LEISTLYISLSIIQSVAVIAIAILHKLYKKRVKRRIERIVNEKTVELKHYTKKLEKHQAELEELVDERTREIKNLNKELTLFNEELTSMNETLEKQVRERTKKLKAQTERILEFGFITSHNLRGPLARILGLINLIEIQSFANSEIQTLLEHLKPQARELNQVVREMVEKLESEHIEESEIE